MLETTRIKRNKDGLPSCCLYRGLTFPLWRGYLTRDELKSGQIYFAYFGGVHLAEKAIRYCVDEMIHQGLYSENVA